MIFGGVGLNPPLGFLPPPPGVSMQGLGVPQNEN